MLRDPPDRETGVGRSETWASLALHPGEPHQSGRLALIQSTSPKDGSSCMNREPWMAAKRKRPLAGPAGQAPDKMSSCQDRCHGLAPTYSLWIGLEVSEQGLGGGKLEVIWGLQRWVQ